MIFGCDFFGFSGLDGEPQLIFASQKKGICIQFYVDHTAETVLVKKQIQILKSQMILASIATPDLEQVDSCSIKDPVARCLERMEPGKEVGSFEVIVQSRVLYAKEHWKNIENARRDCKGRSGPDGKFLTY